ncbi:MAG: alcohol dehydrogenase catalytic domain-containing protein [Proteobacteria bacterium]|nr:alcohol dehydrogenase catalytic domain-containing protein [Pseudomonadota bacterium]
MKIAELTAIGPAEQVVHCVEVPDIGAPGPGEVAVDMLACPINPADILQIEGGYATRPVTPCRIGAEGVGRVRALGRAVSGIGVGDLVINLARDNWVAAQILPASGVIKLPAGIDVQQAAMLKVNAGTAACMLSDFVDLSPGDWVIQNAANSGVGADVIRLARRAGYRTVNIVRRDRAATWYWSMDRIYPPEWPLPFAMPPGRRAGILAGILAVRRPAWPLTRWPGRGLCNWRTAWPMAAWW